MPKGIVTAKGTINYDQLRKDLGYFLPQKGKVFKNIRRIANEIGMDKGTLSAFMRGGGTLRWNNLVLITSWLRVPIETYTSAGAVKKAVSSENTMEAIEKALKRDKTLTPKQRRTLSNLLNSSYRYTLEVLRASHTNHPASRTA